MAGTGRDEAMTTSSEVEVPVPPGVAFSVFTDELDLWWVRGPINHFSGGRMRAMRCEPEVGGRLLEVYDEAGDDVLELARVLPVPAPASINTGPSSVSTAIRWAGFRPSR